RFARARVVTGQPECAGHGEPRRARRAHPPVRRLMAVDCYLGVDGGGTKTRFALVDSGARLLAEAQCATTYHPQVGLDGVRGTLADGIAQVLHAAGATRDDIRHAFFGLPAHGEDSRIDPLLDAI